MRSKAELSNRQLTILAILVFIGDMGLVYPSVMTAYANQDGWIAGLISIPLGLAVLWMMLRVYRLYPDLTLVESAMKITGKWFGGVITIFYLFFFLMLGSVYVREIEDFMCTQIYERTPGNVIRFMAVIIIVYGLKLGLKTIGRAAELMFPLFVLFLSALLILLLPDSHIDKLYPVLSTTSIKDLMHASFFGIFYPFGEMIVFLMVLPKVKRQSHMTRDMLVATLVAAIALNFILFLSLTVLGLYFSKHHFYAAYILAQKINVANILQRIEALMAVTWVISTYFKIALYHYALAVGISQLCKLKNYELLVLPLGFVIFAMSEILSPTIVFYVKTMPPYWVDWNFTSAFLIPLVLLIVHAIRSKFGKGAKSSSAQT
ncbi:Spore germination protein YndE [compost metagenome]